MTSMMSQREDVFTGRIKVHVVMQYSGPKAAAHSEFHMTNYSSGTFEFQLIHSNRKQFVHWKIKLFVSIIDGRAGFIYH